MSTMSLSTDVLDGQKIALDELKHSCETVPFLSEKRLVIINNLIERFDAPSKAEKTRGNKEPKIQKDHTPFTECLCNLPESTIVVLVEDDQPGPAKKDGLFQMIAGKAEVRLFPLVKDQKLRSWIQKRVTDMGGTISPSAQEMLFQLVGSNLWIMAGEIEKLSLLTKGRRIEEDDIRSMVGYSQDVSVFAMIDAIVEFKVEMAGQTLQQLLDQGAAPAYLLFMLDRQFRMIVRAKAMKAERKPDTLIQGKLGIYNEFAFKRTLEQATRYSSERLLQIYQALLDTDIAIKTGRYDNELALNLLVAELCRRPVRNQSKASLPHN